MPSEARTFVGQSGTQALGGFAGFRIGQRYIPRFERLDQDKVFIEPDHAPGGRYLVVGWAEFERWFVR